MRTKRGFILRKGTTGESADLIRSFRIAMTISIKKSPRNCNPGGFYCAANYIYFSANAACAAASLAIGTRNGLQET